MNATQSIDDTERRLHIPAQRGTDNPGGSWLSYRPSDLVGLAALGAVATQCDWGKPRIGKPKRNKVKARMANESRRRNRKA